MFLDDLFFFFFNGAATTDIYTLSLHDALPIYTASFESTPRASSSRRFISSWNSISPARSRRRSVSSTDRKSTRLNSSHITISYAVFCLKKKKKKKIAEANQHIVKDQVIKDELE